MRFETYDQYLEGILSKYDNNVGYDSDRKNTEDMLRCFINLWFDNFKQDADLNITIEQSGSIAKGTAIKGKSDIDLFVSLKYPNNLISIKEFHKQLYKGLVPIYNNIREQNVSIGIKEGSYDIDVVPAKQINTTSPDKLNDHYLWSTKSKGKIQTNIREHISMIKNSSIKDIIMLLKVWREWNGVEFSSVYIEHLCLRELGRCCELPLSRKFFKMMSSIADNILWERIEDPSNSKNIISDTMSETEKIELKILAMNTINDGIMKYIR